MEKVRYAVVGLNHGKEHVAYALKAERVELAALCDTNEDTLNRTAADARGVKRFTDFDALLAWGEFDAAIVAVPPFLHMEFGVKAVRAGKHVLMEKPLTGSLVASRELRDAVKAAPTVASVMVEYRPDQRRRHDERAPGVPGAARGVPSRDRDGGRQPVRYR